MTVIMPAGPGGIPFIARCVEASLGVSLRESSAESASTNLAIALEHAPRPYVLVTLDDSSDDRGFARDLSVETEGPALWCRIDPSGAAIDEGADEEAVALFHDGATVFDVRSPGGRKLSATMCSHTALLFGVRRVAAELPWGLIESLGVDDDLLATRAADIEPAAPFSDELVANARKVLGGGLEAWLREQSRERTVRWFSTSARARLTTGRRGVYATYNPFASSAGDVDDALAGATDGELADVARRLIGGRR